MKRLVSLVLAVIMVFATAITVMADEADAIPTQTISGSEESKVDETKDETEEEVLGRMGLKITLAGPGDTMIQGQVNKNARIEARITKKDKTYKDYIGIVIGDKFAVNVPEGLQFGDEIRIIATDLIDSSINEILTFTLEERYGLKLVFLENRKPATKAVLVSATVDGAVVNKEGHFNSKRTPEEIKKDSVFEIKLKPKYRTVGKPVVSYDPKSKTFTVVFEVKEYEEIKIKISFPNMVKGLAINGEEVKGDYYTFIVGDTYQLTAKSKIEGASLIPYPFKTNPKGLVESVKEKEEVTYTVDKKDKEIFLAIAKAGDFVEGALNAAKGCKNLAIALHEDVIESDDQKTKSALQGFYAIYEGKTYGDAEVFEVESEDKDPVLVAFISMDKAIKKQKDQVTFIGLYEDGTFTQKVSKPVPFDALDFKMDPIIAGDQALTGKTKAGTAVGLLFEKETQMTQADDQGKFNLELLAPVKKGQKLYVQAILDDKSTGIMIKSPEEKIIKPALRIEGSNRYKTAIEVSKKAYPKGSDSLIIASGLNTADALAAGSLAIKMDCPILLVSKDLDKDVQAEIDRLDPQKIIIVGGQAWISQDMQEALDGHDREVSRLAGDNRYETSVKIAKHMMKQFDVDKIVLAEAEKSVDALAVSAYAAKNNMAIILTSSDALPASVKDFIEDDDIDHVDIVGGIKAVSHQIEKDLGSIFKKRLFGATRYETALEVAKATYKDFRKAVVVNGNKGLVDALSAAPYAYKEGAPILLTDSGPLNAASLKFIQDNKISEIVIIGGLNSVSQEAEDKINEMILPEIDYDPKGEGDSTPQTEKKPDGAESDGTKIDDANLNNNQAAGQKE